MPTLDDDRGLSPVLGAVALVAVTVALGATVGMLVQSAPAEPPPRASFDLAASTDGEVTLTHAGGDALDVRDLRVEITVDGDDLAHQPPVPYFAAPGFRGGPTGPFNTAGDPEWTAGETASVQIASTNAPGIAPGSRVTVGVYASNHRIWRGSTVAESSS